jgi:hypothetical protein
MREDEARFPFKRGTWYFDPDAYHAWLVAEVTEHDRLLVARFRALTQAASGKPTERAKGISSGFRSTTRTLRTMKTSMWTGGTRGAWPGKLTAGPGDDHVMHLIHPLRLGGWSEDDIDSLILGDRLGTLVRRAQSEALTNEVAPHLDDRRLGGWLDAARARELAGRLEKDRDLYVHPTGPVLDLYRRYVGEAEMHNWLRLALQEELALLDASAKTDLATRIVTRF